MTSLTPSIYYIIHLEVFSNFLNRNFDHYEQFQYVKNRGVTFQNSDSGIQKCNDHVSSTLRYHQKKSDDRIVCRKFVRERVEGETQW